MKKTKKIFLPRWQRYVITPLFILIWAFITYMEFFSSQAGEMGTVGYIIMSVVFLGVGLMMWLMTSGKLPAYLIEEDTEE